LSEAERLYLFYLFSIHFVHASQNTRTDIKKDAVVILNAKQVQFISQSLN